MIVNYDRNKLEKAIKKFKKHEEILDNLQKEIDELTKSEGQLIYPKEVIIGHTEMTLERVNSKGQAFYYRYHGAWGIHAEWIEGKLMTVRPPYSHLSNLEFTIRE